MTRPRQDTSPAAPSAEHYEAIGFTIHQWNILHMFLGVAVCNLIAMRVDFHKEDTAPAVLTSGMSSRTLIGISQTLVRMRFPEDAAAFDKFADKMQSANKQRDIIAHTVWEPSAREGEVSPLMAKTVGALRRAKGSLSAKDIRAHGEHFSELMIKLLAYLWKWSLAPGAFRERLDEPDPS